MMKKTNYFFIIFIAVFFCIFSKNTHGQNTCNTAIIDTVTNECVEKTHYFNNSDVYWITFQATTKHVFIKVADSMQQIYPVNKIELFQGDCDSLILIKSDSINIFIDDSNLNVGNFYFIKISQAQATSNRFDLILKNTTITVYPACQIIGSSSICCGEYLLIQNLTNPAPVGTDSYGFSITGGLTTVLLQGPTADDFQTNETYQLYIGGQYCSYFTANNNYTLQLHMYYQSSCNPYTTHSITVYPNPVVWIYPENPSICLGESTGLSASGASQYTWAPATGLSSTSGSNVTASPTSTTCYTITGTSAYGCTGSATVTVTVSNPVPDFSYEDVCFGDSMCFYGSAICSSGIIAWSWDFGDGCTSNVQNPCHLYHGPGVYTVVLTTTNSLNQLAYASHDVMVVIPEKPILTGFFNTCSVETEYVVSNVSDEQNEEWNYGLVVGGSYVFQYGLNTSSFYIDWSNYPDGGLLIVEHDSAGCVSSDTITIYPCCIGDIVEEIPPLQLDNIYASSLDDNIISSPVYDVVINGNFIVDMDFTFENVQRFKFGYNAKITVLSGYQLTITDSYLRAGCEFMWDGIYLEDDQAILIFDNNEMKDAINGIVSDYGGVAYVTNSNLHDNFVCMQLLNYGYSSQVNHAAQIYGNTFTGSFSPSFLPLEPLQGVKSLAGIIVNRVGYQNTNYGLTIGDASTESNRNYFISLEFGIFALKSNVKLFNNWFKNYDNDGYNYSFGVYTMGVEPRQQGFYTLEAGGYNTYEKNYFTNTYCGINARYNYEFLVYKNIFDTIYCGMSYIDGNHIGINNEFVSNKITKAYIGFRGYLNTACTTNIHNNYIHCEDSDSYGIWINGHSSDQASNYERWDIRYDTITAVQGINLSTTYCPLMICNTITVSSALNNDYSYGMHITDCNLHQTQYTTITGANKNERTFGVHIENGNEFRFLCSSDISNTDTAMNIYGNNATYYNSIRRLNIKNNRVGIRLAYNGYTGTIGDPTHPCRLVWRTPDNSNCDAYTLFADGTYNTIYYHSSYANENPFLSPISSFTKQSISGSTSSCPSGCVTYGMMMAMAGDTTANLTSHLSGATSQKSSDPAMQPFLNVIYDSIKNPIFSSASSYIGKQSVYVTIKNDTGFYFNNSELRQFVKQADTMNMGKLNAIEGYINGMQYSIADSLNKLINPENDIETLYKYVYDYLISFRQTDTLSVAAINQLRQYAVLCPMEYGRAVYIARSILPAFDTLGTMYKSDCGDFNYKRSEQKPDNSSNPEFVNLYPNPASESVTIQFNINTTNGFEIDFYNYLGARVLGAKVNSNTGSVTLNTSGMAKGMYLYQVTSNGRKIYSDKLIIIK